MKNLKCEKTETKALATNEVGHFNSAMIIWLDQNCNHFTSVFFFKLETFGLLISTYPKDKIREVHKVIFKLKESQETLSHA